MDIYSRNKFLLRIIAVLILLNVFSIGFLWWQRKDPTPDKQNKRDMEKIAHEIKDKLKLNNAQEIELKNIRQDFFRREDSLSKIIKEQRDSMNVAMFKVGADTMEVYQYARIVVENEYQMELYRIAQAQQLKDMCTDEQLKKLQDLVMEIRDYFKPEKKNDERPPEKNRK